MSQLPDVTPQPSGAVSIPVDQPWLGSDGRAIGMEDFDASDLAVPRLKISPKDAMWKDNSGQVALKNLLFIPLGLVKQRVLFHDDYDDNNKAPMCKSNDFTNGFVNIDAPRDKSFPWNEAGFNPSQAPTSPDGLPILPCAQCGLAKWRGDKPPICNETWTMPLYYDPQSDENPEGREINWVPAILSLKSSAITPIKRYLQQFYTSNQAMFLAVAHGTLQARSRGTVDYAVPEFRRMKESPRDRWSEFAQQYGEMRSVLVANPERRDNQDSGSSSQQPQQPAHDNSWGVQPQQQAPAPQQQQDPWGVQPQQQAPAPQQQQDPWGSQPAAPVPQQQQDPWGSQQQAPAPQQQQDPAPQQQDPWGSQPTAPQPAAPPAPQQPTAPPVPQQQAPVPQQVQPPVPEQPQPEAQTTAPQQTQAPVPTTAENDPNKLPF